MRRFASGLPLRSRLPDPFARRAFRGRARLADEDAREVRRFPPFARRRAVPPRREPPPTCASCTRVAAVTSPMFGITPRFTGIGHLR